jgi:hypothetical protein
MADKHQIKRRAAERKLLDARRFVTALKRGTSFVYLPNMRHVASSRLNTQREQLGQVPSRARSNREDVGTDLEKAPGNHPRW